MFTSENEQNYSVPNLERALAIVEYMVIQPQGCRITEISEKLGFPKNSVFRILKTLLKHGYLKETENIYSLTTKFLAIGYAALGEVSLSEKALDIMREIRNKTGETVIFGKIVDSKGVVLEEVPSSQPVKFLIDVGHRFSLHTSAAAKAIMAFLPDDECDRLIETITFNTYTERTLSSEFQFRAELKEVALNGYAFDKGERFTELHCVGVPIFNHRNYPVAAIWISGPAYRLSLKDLPLLGEQLIPYATRISQRLGYEPMLVQ